MLKSLAVQVAGILLGSCIGVYLFFAAFILFEAEGPGKYAFAATWPYYASGAVCLVHPELKSC